MVLDSRSSMPSAAPPPARIVVVDDEESMRHMLQSVLGREGYAVACAADAESALKLLSEEPADVVITDVRMPGPIDGLGLIERMKAEKLDGAVIAMSAYGTRDLALDAVRRGAYHYVNKPFTADDVLLAVAMAVERERLRRENLLLKKAMHVESSPDRMIGRAASMQAVYAMIRKVAEFKSTVLITGESGTGKELVARAIHVASPRASKPFIPVNCGAIPEALIESELFGHAKGAFTGAHAMKKGLAEEAGSGTLFLDEIGELPGAMQVKLLRFLQEEEIRRVGETKPLKVDCRVVAATSRDLQAEVKAGRFREDLFFRLNVLPIHLPPLRERAEDIPSLVEHFLRTFSSRMSSPVTAISPETMKALTEYRWPGNVRELENTIERAVVMASGSTLELGDLPDKLRKPATPEPAAADAPKDRLLDLVGGTLSIKRASEWLERELIRRALEKTGGNRVQAADLLEISARALQYKIRDYKLE